VRSCCVLRAHRIQYYTRVHTHIHAKRIGKTRDDVIIIIIIIIRIMVIDSVPNSNLYNCERRKTDAEPVHEAHLAVSRFVSRRFGAFFLFFCFTNKVLKYYYYHIVYICITRVNNTNNNNNNNNSNHDANVPTFIWWRCTSAVVIPTYPLLLLLLWSIVCAEKSAYL